MDSLDSFDLYIFYFVGTKRTQRVCFLFFCLTSDLINKIKIFIRTIFPLLSCSLPTLTHQKGGMAYEFLEDLGSLRGSIQNKTNLLEKKNERKIWHLKLESYIISVRNILKIFLVKNLS